MDKIFNKRLGGDRYKVFPECSGRGKNLRNGMDFHYRGVDVSHHGFGCIVTEDVTPGDLLSLDFKGDRIHFHVMWSESHLGISGQFRIGLVMVDLNVDFEEKLRVLNLVSDTRT